MTQETLARVLEDIQTLEPEELQEVERIVRERMTPAKEAEREAALRVLQKSGLVKDIKRPSMNARRERAPVPIQGKPLSQTIIEERR